MAVSESNEQTKKTPLNLQIKPKALARLRQIAKNSSIICGTSPQKQPEQQKDDSKETNSHDTNQNKETGESLTSANNSNDVIISSAGSSPAHSPKPEDLVVLSTPPKKSWTKDNHIDNKNVSKNLFDQSDEHRDPTVEVQDKKPIDSVVVDGDTTMEADNVKEEKPSPTQPPPLNFDTAELKKVCSSCSCLLDCEGHIVCVLLGNSTVLCRLTG